jgi:prepilin-type processing-associated H-X9-DG protein
MPYLSQKPTTEGDYTTVDIYTCKGYPNKEQTVTYVVNGWGFGQNDASFQIESTKITSLTRTSESIYLTDYEFIDEDATPIIKRADQPGIETCDIRQQSDLAYMLDGTISETRRVPLDRHSRGSNILYFDWSVGHQESTDIVADLFRTHRN